MTYTKTTWVDRNVSTPRKFTKTLETSGSVTLTPDPGTVTAAGTAVNATRMNALEDAMEQIHTPSVLLTYIKTVDGVGSGLDADLLDGLSSAAFARSGYGVGEYMTSSITDFNTTTLSGMYYAGAVSNAPVAFNEWSLLVMSYNSSYVTQIATSWNTGVTYTRTKFAGTWGSWRGIGGVKNVQRGTVVSVGSGATVNVTVTAVDMAKSYVLLTNHLDGTTALNVRVKLTSTTNIEFYNGKAGTADEISWQLVESY